MFCLKCGKRLPEGAVFCPSCGAPQPAEEPEEMPQKLKPEAPQVSAVPPERPAAPPAGDAAAEKKAPERRRGPGKLGIIAAAAAAAALAAVLAAALPKGDKYPNLGQYLSLRLVSSEQIKRGDGERKTYDCPNDPKLVRNAVESYAAEVIRMHPAWDYSISPPPWNEDSVGCLISTYKEKSISITYDADTRQIALSENGKSGAFREIPSTTTYIWPESPVSEPTAPTFEPETAAEPEIAPEPESGVVYQTMEYLGGTYEGETVNGVPDGQGTHTTDIGTYQGGWKDGIHSGDGTYTWPDGSVFTGQYVNGKRNGPGVYRWSNGEIYDGDWKDDVREGYAVWTSSDGWIYRGSWTNDQMNGPFLVTGPDGVEYSVMVVNGTAGEMKPVSSGTAPAAEPKPSAGASSGTTKPPSDAGSASSKPSGGTTAAEPKPAASAGSTTSKPSGGTTAAEPKPAAISYGGSSKYVPDPKAYFGGEPNQLLTFDNYVCYIMKFQSNDEAKRARAAYEKLLQDSRFQLNMTQPKDWEHDFTYTGTGRVNHLLGDQYAAQVFLFTDISVDIQINISSDMEIVDTGDRAPSDLKLVEKAPPGTTGGNNNALGDCQACGGSGNCSRCGGSGMIPGLPPQGDRDCPNCADGRCRICGGTGHAD